MSSSQPDYLRIKNDVTAYRWIASNDDLDNAFSAGLVPLYQTCFSAPPWNEFYTADDVRNVFYKYSDKQSSILLAYNQQKTVVGFSVKSPLTELPADIVKKDNTMYCYGADLGIEPDYRRVGISTTLEYLQRQKMRADYDIEITRTSSSSYERIASNLKQGKRRLPNTEDVKMIRIDGSESTDKRIYFEQSLRQKNVGPDETLNRVIVLGLEAEGDTALIFDKLTAKKQEILPDLVRDNYPGIKRILFVRNADSMEDPYCESLAGYLKNKSQPVLFNGAMPLNNNWKNSLRSILS